jgi:hypothetical protein
MRLASSINSTGSEAFDETNGDLFRFDWHIIAPGSNAHDGLHDADGRREQFEILGLVGRAEDVGVCGVCLLGGHLVGETALRHESGHLGAAA